MNNILEIAIKVYSLLLRLYPSSFREEFEEQMLLDFKDMAMDAGQKGRFSLILFCVRELIDSPANLLRIYFKEGRMFKVLRSKPVNYGLRSAFVFAVAFGLSGIISEFVFTKLAAPDHSIFGNLGVLYYEVFHTEHGLDFFNWLPSAFASLITGALIGIAFAYLFAERSKRRKYALAGTICWFLHAQIFIMLLYSVNLYFYLGSQHFMILSYTSSALSGAFLGLLFYVARSDRQIPLRLLIIGAFGYPILTYIYVKLLFKFYVVEVPWLFIALMVMYGIYFVSIIVIALTSYATPKFPWFLFLSTGVYVFLPKLGYWIYWIANFIDPVNDPGQVPVDSPEYWSFVFRMAVHNVIYGILLGLVIGILWGLANRTKPQPTTA